MQKWLSEQEHEHLWVNNWPDPPQDRIHPLCTLPQSFFPTNFAVAILVAVCSESALAFGIPSVIIEVLGCFIADGEEDRVGNGSGCYEGKEKAHHAIDMWM